jgi:hypothetical protein
MNPIEGLMQGILRRLGAPTSEQVKGMAKSPFVRDTLNGATGNHYLHEKVRPAELQDGMFGEARPNRNEAWINTGKADWLQSGDTPAGTRNLRNTVIHESSHLVPDPKAAFPSYAAVNRPDLWFDGMGKGTVVRGGQDGSLDSRNETIDLKSGRVKNGPSGNGMFPKVAPSEVAAFKALDPYYRQGKQSRMDGGRTEYEGESFAQAFTNAMGFLEENAQGVTPSYRERIGQLEGNTPGAGQILQDLLRKPIYANHPLRKVIK